MEGQIIVLVLFHHSKEKENLACLCACWTHYIDLYRENLLSGTRIHVVIVPRAPGQTQHPPDTSTYSNYYCVVRCGLLWSLTSILQQQEIGRGGKEEKKIWQNNPGQLGSLLTSIPTLTLIIVDLTPVIVDTILQSNSEITRRGR